MSHAPCADTCKTHGNCQFIVMSVGRADDGIRKDGLSWLGISWLMLSDIVGTSVLTLNGVAVVDPARLGFVLTVLFICGLFPMAVYTSVLMSRTRTILENLGVKEPLGTMGQVAAAAFQSERAGSIVTLVVYGYTALGQASYMLVLGTTLQQLFYSMPLCLPLAVLLSVLALLIPTFGLRRLKDSVALCFFNSMLILAVIVIALVRLGMNRPDCKHTHFFEPGLSFLVGLGAATNVVYSFSGQWMYFELIDTMAEPKDFPKAFLVSGPFMLVTYLAVALLGYWFGAGKMNLINGMPHGPILQALTCRRWFLCVRLCIWSYLNVALSRFNSRVSWRCQQICPTSRWRFFERSSQEFQLCSHESVAMNIGNQDDLMFFGQKVGMMVHSIHYTMVDDCTEVSHRAHCNGRESVQFRGPPKPVQFLRHQNMVNMTQERET
ncbi:unnamed protein product [Cladocopium goreaui]|uniref:N amino acid transport system protein n=1 Tax=Cladocopium goreaui TaxID=2562237 RepID=A0A9P1GRR9_9DINO|nr:unnamed protein product [Cladocopium goreaui]